jgi:hypothetical protein
MWLVSHLEKMITRRLPQDCSVWNTCEAEQKAAPVEGGG